MEERKHLLDYLAQVMIIFGCTVLAIAVIDYFVGDKASDISSMFALGRSGIPLDTIFQYLLSSVCVTALRILFFSDLLIKRLSTALRTIGMLLSVIACISIFSFRFHWFPVNDPGCWLIFLICFAICFVVSLLASIWKERLDNRQLAEALQKLKETAYDNID